MKPRSRRGSLSLFMALILLAVIGLEWVLIRGARQRDAELRAHAMLAHEADRLLANYDSSLFESYGLLALAEEALRPVPGPWARRERAQLPGRLTLNARLETPLLEPDALRAQIVRYMQPLYPGLMMSSVMRELMDAFRSDDLTALASRRYDGPSTWRRVRDLLSSDLVNSSWLRLRDYVKKKLKGKEEAPPLPEDADPELEADVRAADELADSLLDQYRRQSAELERLEVDPALLAEDGVASIAETLDHAGYYLAMPLNVGAERMMLNRYALHMFSSWPHINRDKGYPLERNLRGKKIRDLPRDNRLEVEYLITGLEHPFLARSAAFRSLFCVRTALNGVGIVTNAQKMRTLKSRARFLSAAITFFSLGQAKIDSESMRWVLVVLEAQFRAFLDTCELVMGKSVSLVPFNARFNAQTHYCDYAQLFLLAVPETTLLQRMARRIELNHKKRYFTALSVSLDWQMSEPVARHYQMEVRRAYEAPHSAP